jgi:oxygen-independent coproporphyrinogen-3 oxidase
MIYIHIPFCHRICPYCSFYKHTPGDTDIKRFIAAIITEARHEVHRQGGSYPAPTLYLGGGTPSMLSPRHLRELFEGLQTVFDLHHTHITLEANPATFSINKAQLFKELGVNRVSLGVQSFSPDVLKTLGREHSPEEATESVKILREAGIEEINIDLMFAIPGQSLTDWEDTLTTAIALKPDHISAYNLTYEEDTAFIDRLTRGEYKENEETNASSFTLAHTLLKNAGFHHYETSNYAQPGKESQHNLAYWLGHDYLGLGPSAVSTIQGTRWQNLPDTTGYIHAIETVGHAKQNAETIDASAFRIERIALLLRTTTGLPVSYLEDSPDGAVDELIAHDLAKICEDHLQLINEAPLLVDPIAARLI